MHRNVGIKKNTHACLDLVVVRSRVSAGMLVLPGSATYEHRRRLAAVPSTNTPLADAGGAGLHGDRKRYPAPARITLQTCDGDPPMMLHTQGCRVVWYVLDHVHPDARTLEGFLEALPIHSDVFRRIVVVGYSMGCATALAVARALAVDERVRPRVSLVLLAPFLSPIVCGTLPPRFDVCRCNQRPRRGSRLPAMYPTCPPLPGRFCRGSGLTRRRPDAGSVSVSMRSV